MLSVWTKYDYVCTNCDALIEITTQVPEVMYPDCICGRSMIVSISVNPAFSPVITEVSKITPRQVVKIDSNPYN